MTPRTDEDAFHWDKVNQYVSNRLACFLVCQGSALSGSLYCL